MMQKDLVEYGQKTTNFSKTRLSAKGLCNPLIIKEKKGPRTRKGFLG